MASKAPKTIKWKEGTVYNSSPVLAADWQTLDELCTYLASCRHLQIPINIGYPLQANNTWACTLRVPAFTTWLAPKIYGNNHPDSAVVGTNDDNWVEVTCTTGGTPNANLSSRVQVGNSDTDGDSVLKAEWWGPNYMLAQDVPVDGTPFPILMTWAAQEAECDFEVTTGIAVHAHYVWLQSEIVDLADLNV